MIPEAELIRKEYIIREIDYSQSIEMTKKSLLRWCCLSLGLISKNETRDKAFLAFDALFHFLFTKKTNPTTLDIQGEIKKKYKENMSEKLIRYHLNRLINLNLIKRKNNKYFLNPSPTSEKRQSLSESYKAFVEEQVKKEMEKTAKTLEKLQEKYS